MCMKLKLLERSPLERREVTRRIYSLVCFSFLVGGFRIVQCVQLVHKGAFGVWRAPWFRKDVNTDIEVR